MKKCLNVVQIFFFFFFWKLFCLYKFFVTYIKMSENSSIQLNITENKEGLKGL